MIPSLSDFGTHGNSLYPHLWDRCFFAFAPGLGNSSNKAIDWATGTTSVFTNFSAARWGYDSGIPYLEGGANDSTNTRARFNWQSSNNPISLAAWVYWTGQATNAVPFTVGGTDAYFRISTGTSIPEYPVNNGNGRALGVTAVSVDGWTHLCGVRDRSELRLYVNGVLDKTTAYSAGAVNTGTTIGVYSLQDVSSASNYFAGRVDDAFAWSRPLNDDEIKLLSSQRNIAFVPRRQTLRIAWAAIEEVTGTAPVTLGAATASATGTQTHSGTAAISTAGATASANGTQTHSGTAAISTAGATASASGSALEGVVGAATVTLAAAAAAASGTQTHTGTAAILTTGPSATASGQVVEPTTGAVAHLLGPVTATGSGAVTVTGSVAIISGTVSSTSSGLAGVTGTGQATAGAVCVSTGLVGSQGAVNVTTSGVGVTMVGSVTAAGSVAVTTGTATITASGLVPVVDVSLTGSIDRPALTGRIDVQALTGRIAVETLGGKKLWR